MVLYVFLEMGLHHHPIPMVLYKFGIMEGGAIYVMIVTMTNLKLMSSVIN